MNYEPLWREALRREAYLREQYESLQERYLRVLEALTILLGGDEAVVKGALAIAWLDGAETEGENDVDD